MTSGGKVTLRMVEQSWIFWHPVSMLTVRLHLCRLKKPPRVPSEKGREGAASLAHLLSPKYSKRNWQSNTGRWKWAMCGVPGFEKSRVGPSLKSPIQPCGRWGLLGSCWGVFMREFLSRLEIYNLSLVGLSKWILEKCLAGGIKGRWEPESFIGICWAYT